MKKFKKHLAMILACTVTVCACPVYGAARDFIPEKSTTEDVFFYEEPSNCVPGRVLVCVAGGAEMLAADMAAAESTDAGLLGASGTDVAGAREALSLYTCSLTAREAVQESGGMMPEETAELLLGSGGEELTSEILLLTTEEGREREAAAFLNDLPHVEFAEPDYRHDFADIDGDYGNDFASFGDGSRYVTDPDAWKKQWAYNGSSKYGMGGEELPIWEDERVNAPVNPEKAGYDKDQIVVALLDSGVDYNNPEIRPVLWNCPEDLRETLGCGEYGWNVCAITSGEGDPTDPADEHGHGTHCAGIIGASWKNGGIYGIANNVKIMALRIGGKAGITDSDSLAGFSCVKKAVENGVNVAVTSNSWGGAYRGFSIERAVLELGKMGTLSVFASGNEAMNIDVQGDTTSGMAADPYVLSVNSHDVNGEISYFSNFGLKTTHISAPGEQIYSACAEAMGGIDPADVKRYVPVADGISKKVYHAPVEDVTIASPSVYIAEENAFRFLGEELATASTAQVHAIDDDNTYLVSVSTVPGTEPPYVDLLADLSEADLSYEDGLFFGFRLTAAGWITGRAPNYDKAILTVTAVDVDGTEHEIFDKTYNIAFGKPIAVSAPLRKETDHLRIRLYVARYDTDHKAYVYADPGYAAFDDFLITEHCGAYVSMSGTSMACPAIAGEAAVLAGEFARLPSETRAKELQARILGAVVPFKAKEDRDKNRSGGYASLVKAMTEDYAPVIQEASFDRETKRLTLHGYFFPDAAKAKKEGWYVLLNNTRITDIDWSSDRKTASFAMGNADQGTGEYTICMMSAASEKFGRHFLVIDTGTPASGLMERVDISGTDPDLGCGPMLGMVPLNEKLYLLELLECEKPEETGFAVWSWDTRKGGAFRRVNQTAVTPGTLGNPDLIRKEAGMPTAFKGKVIFPVDYEEPVTGTYVTYLIIMDPEKGTVKAFPAASENYGAMAECLGVVSLGEKLVFIRSFSESTASSVTEISLYEMKTDGTMICRAVHTKKDTDILCDFLYQEDGTFLATGLIRDADGERTGLFRWTVTAEDAHYEYLREGDYDFAGEMKDPGSQSTMVFSAPLKDALITTGIQNTRGNDTCILKGLSGEGRVSACPRSVDSAKILNFAVAATNGKYYVLAQTRNGEEDGRLVFCRQDLKELGLQTIKNPGDTKKPVPPGPVPYGGGGGGSVKSSGQTYSRFWVQAGDVWAVVDRQGQIVKNAWLCDDAVPENGQNAWYLLKADGTMASDGLLMDGSGNYYSLEQEHKGYFGSLRNKDGYYDVAGTRVYLTFCHDHNGAFGAITNPEGLAALKNAYGVAVYANGNESIRYTSKF